DMGALRVRLGTGGAVCGAGDLCLLAHPAQLDGGRVEPVVDVVHHIALAHADDLELLGLDALRRDAMTTATLQRIDDQIDEVVDGIEVVSLTHPGGAELRLAAHSHLKSLLPSGTSRSRVASSQS